MMFFGLVFYLVSHARIERNDFDEGIEELNSP